MKIVFFCPPVSVINGGIKYTFRMAECLRELGYDAIVFEQNAQRPTWFTSSVPIVGQGIFSPDADHIYVLPEDQPHILSSFRSFPQRKLIYSQNHFYGALGIGDTEGYADYGITDIICSSLTIYNHSRLRHPKLLCHLVPYGVNNDLFRPSSEKHDVITYMPRKRSIEAAYIRDMFRFIYPEYRNWQWLELNGLGESEVAAAMARARIFLSLSRLEGFGLTPLEAMASGCVVSGFTGIGGREYATTGNGFWADEDDFPSCISQLAAAIRLLKIAGNELINYHRDAQKTVTAYSIAAFRQATEGVWNHILQA